MYNFTSPTSVFVHLNKFCQRINLLLGFVLIALWLCPLHTQAQSRCPHCNNGYVRPFPKVSGYGTRESKKKCPNCGQWVYSGHVCKCRYCNGTGRIGSGSSYRNQKSKSSIHKTQPITNDYDPAQELLNTARFHKNGEETITFLSITETWNQKQQWLNSNVYPNYLYQVNGFLVTANVNIKGCNNVVVSANAMVYYDDGSPVIPDGNYGSNRIYIQAALSKNGGYINQVSPGSRGIVHLTSNNANVTFRIFVPTGAFTRPGAASECHYKYKVMVNTTDWNRYYSDWRYFCVTW